MKKRYFGKAPVAWDERSGMKVRHDELVEDGEIRGLYTHTKSADGEHPLKFRIPPAPDLRVIDGALAPNEGGTLTMRPSTVWNTTTMEKDIWPCISIQTGMPGVNLIPDLDILLLETADNLLLEDGCELVLE